MHTPHLRRAATQVLWWMSALILTVSAGLLVAPARAASQANAQIKAVMIYNIIRFMALPGPHGQVRLCLKAGEDIAAAMNALDGQPVGNAQLEVTLLAPSGDAPHSCDVLYAGPAWPGAHSAPAHGQITIGEGASFAQSGGTVGLISFGGQLRFIINARAAAHAGIAVNSQLMRLAARVIN